MSIESQLCITVILISIPIAGILLRLIYILPFTTQTKSINNFKSIKHLKNKHISIFLGSGGHTGEMLKLTSKLDLNDIKTTWIYSKGDIATLNQIKQKGFANTKSIHRAKNVGDSIPKAIFNSIYSIIDAFITLYNVKSDLIIMNGPGTSFILAFAIFIMKFFGLNSTKIIYIESLARSKKLSLTGRLILPISDRFIVQWENLANQYNRVEYYGILL
ncbi:ALG14 [Candida pseudojiufengensis]|uniref:ALG14 n=1 Tax=Candida pseudojiufengensis TaxID=497109 RepID=UPI002224217E|nr:ALG14 [Candida pseudojiufengensis]KAI5960082.1 ALG14 [Candida pseudojiufengensis]